MKRNRKAKMGGPELDYIAEVLRECREAPEPNVDTVVRAFCRALAKTNKRFDAERFKDATRGRRKPLTPNQAYKAARERGLGPRGMYKLLIGTPVP